MSKKDRSHTEFLVVDIECSCWEEGQTPPDQISEIIEIGYATFDCTNNIIHSNGSIFVKPTNSNISKFCTDLTGITSEQVEQGVSFEEACRILREDLNSLSKPWASVGNYDLDMFDKQCKRMNILYPFTKQHLNIKQMAAAINGKTRGLGGILSVLGLQFEGRRHDGKADAFNAARILQHYQSKLKEKHLV